MNLSRAQLSDYVNSLNEISAQAQKAFADELWSVYNATGKDIDMLHDAINMLAPSIADQYGSVASTIAADLWERIYKADTGLSADATIDSMDTSHLFGASSGYAFRNGKETDATAAIAHVAGTMGRAVRNHARSTMRSNTDRHGGRYARVPTGDKTCAFCLMLASRGFIYLSEDSAGEFDQYHDDCDCEVVASFDEKNSAIEGYSPDEYYKMYKSAREQIPEGEARAQWSALSYSDQNKYAGYNDFRTKGILGQMRDMYGFS